MRAELQASRPRSARLLRLNSSVRRLTDLAWGYNKNMNIKEEAKRIIDTLPENSSWEDIMHRIYVRQSIEAGLKDIEEGRTIDVEELRAKYGLKD
jgi:predicted transcriptional regulator